MPLTPQPLRFPIGPSPWATINHSFEVAAVAYHFRETIAGNHKFAGLTSLQDASGSTLLILDFQYYVRILDGGKVLLWKGVGARGSKRIVFDSFLITSLQRIADPLMVATQLRENGRGISPLSSSQHWEFAPRLEGGLHPMSLPHDWSDFEETLVLADHADSNGWDKMSRAIFAFDWCKRQVEVLPQDWFNNGNYDFGYQWITRVVRRIDGSIVGDGIRLGAFELDGTQRQVKKWMTQDPFYRIS